MGAKRKKKASSVPELRTDQEIAKAARRVQAIKGEIDKLLSDLDQREMATSEKVGQLRTERRRLQRALARVK